MRKVRHLQNVKYISNVGGHSRTLSTISGQSNIILEKINRRPERIEFILFAKFNSATLNGLQIVGYLTDNREIDSVIDEFKIYRISDGSWAETFVASVPAIKDGVKNIGTCLQSSLGLNELSGAETYLIKTTARRRNRIYIKQVYINHLGCFDSIVRLRQEASFLNLSKADR
jgi:hypothetical protein